MIAMAQNEKELAELEGLLRSGNFLTVAEIARLMKCSRPVAYGRVRALIERRLPIEFVWVRQGRTGPEARAFTIVSNREKILDRIARRP